MDIKKGDVASHYGSPELVDRILASLSEAGKSLDSLTVDDFASFDNLHLGGVDETLSLARLATAQHGMSVLDVGSGLGASARTLASNFGCHVVGLDITPEFCEAAELLSGLVGLGDMVSFKYGDALNMPFDDASFDLVWTQHTSMNIEEKSAFLAEIARVLRPEGILAVHDITAGPQLDIHYPVPWADNKAMSFLVSPGRYLDLFHAAGFETVEWTDVTYRAMAWMRQQPPRSNDGINSSKLLSIDFLERVANVQRNLEEGCIEVTQGVLRKKSDE